MANQRKITNKRMAVLAYDGRDWFAFSFHRQDTNRFKEVGSATSIPAGVLNFLREQRAKVVRLLLEGEVHRLETTLPAKLSFAEASSMMAHEVAELSGTDGMGLVCAVGSGSVVGSLDPCTLCGAFDRQQVDGLRLQLTQAGFQFDGVGSLEMACAAHWNAHHDRDKESLILFRWDHGFVLPARSLPDQPGPISLSGGLRQVERDPETWQTRFLRGNRYLAKAQSIAVFVLGAEAEEVATALEGIEELPNPDFPELEALLEGAARQASLGQANQFGAPVPIRNPHVLRKRFSHAFIAVPCVLLLLSPLLVYGFSKLSFHLAQKEYQKVVAEFGPLEKRIEDAEKMKERAQANYSQSVALQQQLADRRKPLFAFIHLAYFFSKYAGNTVRLESIADNGKEIDVRGIYTDPEDGLSLKAELNDFAADKDLRIVRDRVEEKRNAEGKVSLQLELGVDYQTLSK